MPKLNTPVPEAVELDYIKKRIAAEIQRGYSMNVAEFSRSEDCKKLGIDGSHLPVYLSGGSVSFKVLSRLWSALGLGEMSQQQTRTTQYFVTKK